jgi:hypothetical protein
MNELTVVDKTKEWRRMKSLVLDSVSSPITKRVYSMAPDEFFDWYRLEPRPGFSKATVKRLAVTLRRAWPRVVLDHRPHVRPGNVPLIAHRFFCASAIRRRVAAERFRVGASGVAVSPAPKESMARSSTILPSMRVFSTSYPMMAAVISSGSSFVGIDASRE